MASEQGEVCIDGHVSGRMWATTYLVSDTLTPMSWLFSLCSSINFSPFPSHSVSQGTRQHRLYHLLIFPDSSSTSRKAGGWEREPSGYPFHSLLPPLPQPSASTHTHRLLLLGLLPRNRCFPQTIAFAGGRGGGAPTPQLYWQNHGPSDLGVLTASWCCYILGDSTSLERIYTHAHIFISNWFF